MSGDGKESVEDLFIVAESVLHTDSCYDGQDMWYIAVVGTKDQGIVTVRANNKGK